MKKLFPLFGLLASCGMTGAPCPADAATKKESKVLIVFFSHTGENYAVGEIEQGNTHIVAEMIAQVTRGELFEIVPEQPYPHRYKECIEAAKREKEQGARPAYKQEIRTDAYDTIFIGYPNWWGDMPMIVYTFLEQHDWNGKRIIPFCTHEGSGLSNTEKSLARTCSGATVEKGLALHGSTAQNKRDEARQSVRNWLKKLGF